MMEGINEVMWEIYFPQILSQYEHRSFFDDDETWAIKQQIATSLKTTDRSDITQWMADCQKAIRRGKYEELKREFESE